MPWIGRMRISCMRKMSSRPRTRITSIKIKEHENSTSQLATKDERTRQENTRGICFDIMDVTLGTDASRRGAGQIVPFTRPCYLAAAFAAQSTRQEPVLLAEITCPQNPGRRSPSVRFERGVDRAGRYLKVTYDVYVQEFNHDIFESDDEEVPATQVVRRTVEMPPTQSDDRVADVLVVR